MLKTSIIAVGLLLAACASPGLPHPYRSQAVPGAIDCSAFPEPPAPASCRNLYEDITHPVRTATRP